MWGIVSGVCAGSALPAGGRTPLRYFFNDAGKQCYLTGKDIINDAKQLGYRYGDEKVPAPPKPVNCPVRRPTAGRILLEHRPPNRITLGTTPVSIEVPLKETAER